MCEFISEYIISKMGDGLKIMKGVIIWNYVKQNLQTAFSVFDELLCSLEWDVLPKSTQFTGVSCTYVDKTLFGKQVSCSLCIFKSETGRCYFWIINYLLIVEYYPEWFRKLKKNADKEL